MALFPFVNEPFLDFSQPAERQRMEEAVAKVREQLGRTYGLRIEGREEVTSRRARNLCPADPSLVVGEYSLADREDAERAVAAARRAQPLWARVPVEERAAFLLRAADLMRRRRRELLAWVAFEVGKNFTEGDGELAEAIDHFEYNARRLAEWAQGREIQPLTSEINHYRYLPLGVGVVIAPWNFPTTLPLGQVLAAIAVGNAVVLKPAEEASVVAHKLMDVLEEAGLPPGVVNLLTGLGEEVGPLLITHPDVRFVAFVGSRAVGLEIYRQATAVVPGQREMRRVMTEMGGKNAIVVADDADLDLAAAEVAKAAFGYQGQKCSACSRLIVQRSVYPEMVERVVERARRLAEAVGHPWENAPYGPLINEQAVERALAYQMPERAGGTVTLAGRRLDRPGYHISPAVVTDVPTDAPLWRDEVFAPVLACCPADSVEEALDLANDSLYALTGGFFSRDPARLALARERFYVGNLYLNRACTGAMAGVHPFGGYRQSGTGPKVGGPDYLSFFSQAQAITERVRF